MGKQPELSASLVAVKGSAAPAPDMPPRAAATQPVTKPAKSSSAVAAGEESLSASLNFKVTNDFHREFKSYAASQGMKLNEFLPHIYKSYRKQKGD